MRAEKKRKTTIESAGVDFYETKSNSNDNESHLTI